MQHSAQQTLSKKYWTIKVKYESTTSTLTRHATPQKIFSPPGLDKISCMHVYCIVAHWLAHSLNYISPLYPYLKHLLLLRARLYYIILLLVGLIIFVCGFLAAFNPTLEGLNLLQCGHNLICYLKARTQCHCANWFCFRLQFSAPWKRFFH